MCVCVCTRARACACARACVRVGHNNIPKNHKLCYCNKLDKQQYVNILAGKCLLMVAISHYQNSIGELI